MGQGNSSAAIEHFKEAIKINPNYSQAYNNLGSALLDKGHLNGSIDVFRNLVNIGPEMPETHYNIGIQLYKGDVKNAVISSKEQSRLTQIMRPILEFIRNISNYK